MNDDADLSPHCSRCGAPLDASGVCPNGCLPGSGPPGPGSPGTTEWGPCPVCGQPRDAAGRCPQGHSLPAQGTAPHPAGDGGGWEAAGASLGQTLALAWRLLTRQPAVLWIAVQAALAAAVWLGLLLGVGLGVGLAVAGGALAAGTAFPAPRPPGFPPTGPGFPPTGPGFAARTPFPLAGAPGPLSPFVAALPRIPILLSHGLGVVLVVFVALTVLFVVPYVEAATVGGLMRAVEDRVQPLAFWSDGLRYLGRSYLAFIAVLLLSLVPLAAGGLWSVLLFHVGHVVGPVVAVLADLALAVYFVPYLGGGPLALLGVVPIVALAVFQSGWAGFGRAVRLTRSRWLTLFLLVIALFVLGGAATAVGGALAAVPGLGLVLTALVSAAAGLFAVSAMLIQLRTAEGMPLGPWAAAAAPLSGTGGGTLGTAGTRSVPGSGSAPPVAGGDLRAWLPEWGALWSARTYALLPALLGTPREGFALWAEAVTPAQALAVPAAAWTLFGAVLVGLWRPFWLWIIGAALGFAFAVAGTRVVARLAVALLASEGIGVEPGLAESLLGGAFLLALPLAALTLLFGAAMGLGYAAALGLAAVLLTFPPSVGAFQMVGSRGWRSLLVAGATTAALLLVWLLLQSILLTLV